MKTATRLSNLEVLGYVLQGHLQQHLSPTVPLQVQCLRKEETLIVVTQHPVQLTPDPQRTFQLLEQVILEQEISDSKRVLLYLRVTGQKQPYAFHTFTLPEEAIPPIESMPETDFPVVEEIENPPEEFVSSSFEPESVEIAAEKRRFPLPLVFAGAGIGLVMFLGSLYALSRPCVVGTCTAIPKAQKLSSESEATFQRPQSGKEILDAQEKLNNAIALLEDIPYWSNHYNDAQSLLATYRLKADKVETVVVALQKAAKAGYAAQNPPHSAEEWLKVQQLWREAIAPLERVPRDSKLYKLAQQKTKSYKANLAAVNQRTANERRAKASLAAAKQAAQIAEVRQGVAQSLESWQVVYSTWQIASNRVKEIPEGTTSYTEAQQLLALYQPKMAIALGRKTEEQSAQDSIKRSLRLAQLARNSQASNQWTAAVINWRGALTYIRQVPNTSFYYTKTPQLVNFYTAALSQAQAQLRVATVVQQALQDLKQTCVGSPQVCTYAVANNIIKVRLTPAYMQKIKQTAQKAKAKK